MGRILLLVVGAVVAYIGSGYLEGLLSEDTERESENSQQSEA